MMQLGRRVWKIGWVRRTVSGVVGLAVSIAAGAILGPGGAVSRCLGVVVLCAWFWLFETVPLTTTAFLPVPLFAILGIASAASTAMAYFDSIACVQVGGFIIAWAVEHWGFHERIALAAITAVRSRVRLLIVVSFFTTYSLSMWMSNTAAVLLLYPNCLAIVNRIVQASAPNPAAAKPIVRSLLLSITWGSSIGGTATIVGTPTNLLFAKIYTAQFPHLETLGFGRWMLFMVPVSLLLSVCALLVLLLGTYSKNCSSNNRIDLSFCKRQYAALPKMTFEEIIVVCDLGILALAWFFRGDLVFGSFTLRGWASLFGHNSLFIDDAVPSILIPCALFFIPARSSKQYKQWSSRQHGSVLENFGSPLVALTPSPTSSSGGVALTAIRQRHSLELDSISEQRQRLVTIVSSDGDTQQREEPVASSRSWDTFILDAKTWKKLPWDMLFLLGGGIALASGITKSGLGTWLAQQLSALQTVPLGVAVLATTAICALLTQFVSNVSSASIMLPVLANISVAAGIHPILLMLPAAIASSFAWAFPVATVGNVVVLSSGHLSTRDFVVLGGVTLALGIPVLTLCTMYYLPVVWSRFESGSL